MLKTFNILIIGLSLLYYATHAKDISTKKESISSSFKEIAEEMKHLNSNLELLSNTISKLVP